MTKDVSGCKPTWKKRPSGHLEAYVFTLWSQTRPSKYDGLRQASLRGLHQPMRPSPAVSLITPSPATAQRGTCDATVMPLSDSSPTQVLLDPTTT